MTQSSAPRILYVEDNQDISEYIRLLLTAAGYEVTLAGKLVEGLRLTKTRNFDLFLLDNFLPDGSGIELCRLIRTFDVTTPIVLYSSITDDTTKEAAFTAGAQRYIGKQESLENLEQTISQLIKAQLQLKTGVGASVEQNVVEVSQKEFDQLVQRYNSDFRFLLMRASLGQYDCLLTSFLVLKDLYGAISKLHEVSRLELRVIPYPISLRPSNIMFQDLGFTEQDVDGINGFLQSIRDTQGREFEELLDEGLPILCGPRLVPLAY